MTLLTSLGRAAPLTSRENRLGEGRTQIVLATASHCALIDPESSIQIAVPSPAEPRLLDRYGEDYVSRRGRVTSAPSIRRVEALEDRPGATATLCNPNRACSAARSVSIGVPHGVGRDTRGKGAPALHGLPSGGCPSSGCGKAAAPSKSLRRGDATSPRSWLQLSRSVTRAGACGARATACSHAVPSSARTCTRRVSGFADALRSATTARSVGLASRHGAFGRDRSHDAQRGLDTALVTCRGISGEYESNRRVEQHARPSEQHAPRGGAT
jgi:hypothetical protein